MQLSRALARDINRLQETFNVTITKESYWPERGGNAILRLVGPEIGFMIMRDLGDLTLWVYVPGPDAEDAEVIAGLPVGLPRGHQLAEQLLQRLGLHPEPECALQFSAVVDLFCANASDGVAAIRA